MILANFVINIGIFIFLIFILYFIFEYIFKKRKIIKEFIYKNYMKYIKNKYISYFLKKEFIDSCTGLDMSYDSKNKFANILVENYSKNEFYDLNHIYLLYKELGEFSKYRAEKNMFIDEVYLALFFGFLFRSCKSNYTNYKTFLFNSDKVNRFESSLELLSNNFTIYNYLNFNKNILTELEVAFLVKNKKLVLDHFKNKKEILKNIIKNIKNSYSDGVFFKYSYFSLKYEKDLHDLIVNFETSYYLYNSVHNLDFK